MLDLSDFGLVDSYSLLILLTRPDVRFFCPSVEISYQYYGMMGIIKPARLGNFS